MIKIRRGRVELSFPEVKARYIHLTLTAAEKIPELVGVRNLCREDPTRNQRESPEQRPLDLLGFLQANKVQTVYADHWLSAVLRVESGRRIRTMESNHFLGDNGEKDPSPDQRAPVSFDAGTAFVLEQGNGPLFMESIRPADLACARRTFGPYEVFYQCGKKEKPAMDPTGWKVSASVNRDGAGNAVDGIRGTRWSSEKPQHPGMFFAVDLGDIFSVRGLALSQGNSRQDFPRRLKVLGSRDGKAWSEIETDWTSDFYWAGNVLLRMRGERIDYLFDPVEVRFLKLLQEGSDPKYFWSVHELTVYGKKPGK